MKCVEGRQRALFHHVNFEVHKRIHGGGVTKPLRNASGIQGKNEFRD